MRRGFSDKRIHRSLGGFASRWVISCLVALAVIGMVVGLLMPAIQKVREAQARTGSICHLKQIGIAGLAFHDAQKRLPFNGSKVAVNGVDYLLLANPGEFTSGSWGFQILPYLDQRAAFDAGTSDTGIPAYMFPGRRRPTTGNTRAVRATTSPWADYVINPWLNDERGGSTDAADAKRTLVGIQDGSSSTIFFGHGQIRPADYSASDVTPGYLDTILIGGTTATALSSNPALGPVTFARDSAGTCTDAARGFGSPFSQGCLMAMCDGTVQMFPYDHDEGEFGGGGRRWEAGTFGESLCGGYAASAYPTNSVASFLTSLGCETVTLPDY